MYLPLTLTFAFTYTLSIHLLSTTSQYIVSVSVHHLSSHSTCSQCSSICTLSTLLSNHSINPSHQPTLSTHPIKPPYQTTPSTHLINPPYQPVLPYPQNKMDEDSTDYQSKWRRLGDLALANGDITLAKTCASRSGQYT